MARRYNDISVNVFEIERRTNVNLSSDNYIVYLCHCGSMDLTCDGDRVRFSGHDVAVVYPQHTVVMDNPSFDCRFSQMIVSAPLYDSMARLKMSKKRAFYEQSPVFHLTYRQYDDLVSLLDALRRLALLDIPDRETVLTHQVYIVMQLIDMYHSTNVKASLVKKPRFAERFYNVISENYKQHHDVQFYADYFCLSAKHFSSVVKRDTNHSASYWIQHFVVSRAKQILIYDPNASIQEVAADLGFSDQALLCRYFKRKTGLSPSEYRKENGDVGKESM